MKLSVHSILNSFIGRFSYYILFIRIHPYLLPNSFTERYWYGQESYTPVVPKPVMNMDYEILT